MKRISLGLAKNKLPQIMKKYKTFYKNHLSYFIISMNKDDLREFEVNKALIENLNNSNIICVHKLVNGINTFFFGSDTIEKDNVYIAYTLDKDEAILFEELKNIAINRIKNEIKKE